MTTPEEQPTGIVYYQDASRRMLYAFEDRLQATIPNSVVQYLRLCAHPVVAFFHCLAAISLYIALFQLFYHYFTMAPIYIVGTILTTVTITTIGYIRLHT